MIMDYRISYKTLVASLMLATLVSAPVSGPLMAQEAGPSPMANLVIQVQELQDEVRMLRGQLEEQSTELENLKRRQRDQYLDLDQRLSDMRNAQPVASGGPIVTTRQGPTVSPAEDAPEIRAPMESQSQVNPIGQPMAQSQSAPVSALDEKAAYDQAFQALKELRYADAAEDFQSFLDQYPNSEYADSLLSQYPESPKAPDALLKIGYTHYELEQWDSARAALTQVQEDYPDTTLSRLAENRLRSMRMEGHY